MDDVNRFLSPSSRPSFALDLDLASLAGNPRPLARSLDPLRKRCFSRQTTRQRALSLWSHLENDKIKSPTTTHHKNVGNLISDFPVVINQRRRARAAGDERRHFRFVVFQQRRERCRCCCHDDARLSFSLSLFL